MNSKKLIEAFGITEDEAKELARMMRKAVDSGDVQKSAYPYEVGPLTTDDVLERANEILHGHGVESIDCENCQVSRYYYGIVLLYLNKGDTYDTTLLYDTDKEEFAIGSWGSWLEDHEAKKHESEEEEGEEGDPGQGSHSVKDWRPR